MCLNRDRDRVLRQCYRCQVWCGSASNVATHLISGHRIDSPALISTAGSVPALDSLQPETLVLSSQRSRVLPAADAHLNTG